MISENLEMAKTSHIMPSVTSENFIFFSSLIFVSGNLALKSKEVKQQQQQTTTKLIFSEK